MYVGPQDKFSSNRDETERNGGLAPRKGKSLALSPSERAPKFVAAVAYGCEFHFQC